MLARVTAATVLALAAVGLMAAPASANCGGVGLPGKPPIIIFHC